MTARYRRALVIALGLFSSAATVAGFVALTAFDESPGVAAGAPVQWPANTSLAFQPDRPRLLVFIHPLCSCTGATVAELAKLWNLPAGVRMPETVFVAAEPSEGGRGDYPVSSQASWFGKWFGKVSSLPGATVVRDAGGVEARRFHADTSGYILLYGSNGALLFQGGVTGSRGHEGDNLGLSQLRMALSGAGLAPVNAHARTSPVFGCALAAKEFWLDALKRQFRSIGST
jgi:hypothetical protein